MRLPPNSLFISKFPKINYDCSRGVAELSARLSVVAYCYAIQQVGVLWLSVSKLPIAQHSNSMPSALPPHTYSCSAQTLRRVSSFVAVLRKRVYFTELASVKRIGGSRGPLAREYLHSSPNPSFVKGGTLAMEFYSLFAYFFVY